MKFAISPTQLHCYDKRPEQHERRREDRNQAIPSPPEFALVRGDVRTHRSAFYRWQDHPHCHPAVHRGRSSPVCLGAMPSFAVQVGHSGQAVTAVPRCLPSGSESEVPAPVWPRSGHWRATATVEVEVRSCCLRCAPPWPRLAQYRRACGYTAKPVPRPVTQAPAEG
jgi:hypothetical protein